MLRQEDEEFNDSLGYPAMTILTMAISKFYAEKEEKKNLWNKNLANKKQIHKKDCLDLTSELAIAGSVSLSTLKCGQIGTVTKSHSSQHFCGCGEPSRQNCLRAGWSIKSSWVHFVWPPEMGLVYSSLSYL